MILVPLRRIERRLYPGADGRVLGSVGVASDHDGEAPGRDTAHSPSQEDTSSDAFAVPCIGAVCPAGSDESCPSLDSSDPMPIAGVETPFPERPVGRCRPAPSSLRIGESCAASEPEYREIYGPAGSIQRCKEQFIASRFTPRKTLHSDRSERLRVDLGRTTLDSAEVCVIPFSRTSRAA